MNEREKVENTVAKGEKTGYQHFLLFPPCFQKISVQQLLKLRFVWYRVKENGFET